MKATDFAQEFRDQIVQLRIDGNVTVETNRLIAFFERKIPELAAAEDKETQVAVDFRVTHYQGVIASAHKMFESVLDYGKHALNTVMIVNAGAALAMMTLIGNLTPIHPKHANASGFAMAALLFFCGVFVGLLASGLAYITQVYYAELPEKPYGSRFRVATVLICLTGYLFFAAGGLCAYFNLK